jgi:hypothetical protein
VELVLAGKPAAAALQLVNSTTLLKQHHTPETQDTISRMSATFQVKTNGEMVLR